MKQSTKEFLQIINPLGLENPMLTPERTKRIYKMWKRNKRKMFWSNVWNKILFRKYTHRIFIQDSKYIPPNRIEYLQ